MRFPLFAIYFIIALGLQLSGCDVGGGGGGSKSGAGDPNPSETPSSGKTTISEDSITVTEISTVDTGDEACTSITFVVRTDNKPAEGVELKFSFKIGTNSESTAGSVDPESAKTDDKGLATTKFCSGTVEGTASVVAKVGNLSANSSDITVTGLASFKFSYEKTDLAAEKVTNSGKLLNLNVFESTNNDCTHIYFRLSAKDKGIANETIEFRSPSNYPKGFKLAAKANDATTKIDTTTSRRYLYYTAKSDSKGLFKVPVCAGSELGTSVVNATYTAPDGGVYTVSSPIIKVISGLSSYGSFSLQFDPNDSRSLLGNFSSNLTGERTLKIQTGTVQNGFPVDDFSVNVASEYGYAETIGSAVPNAAGIVEFKLNQTHLSVSRPFEKFRYSNPLARTRCDVESLALNSSINGSATTADIAYTSVAQNWRSTVIYYTQGSEEYYDANRNGRYDAGGDGFWDKNQNGIFDAGDALTYDANSNGQADGEWFIDLPSPFVDVDEDGTYDATKDKLVGDEYQAANGKWDVATQIWRYRVFPLDMGNSSYAMRHGQVRHNAFANQSLDTIGGTYFTDLNTRGFSPGDNDPTGSYGAPEIWGLSTLSVTSIARAAKWYYLHIKDVCGNVLSGGTQLSLTFTDTSVARYGDRGALGHFYIQPSDETREPSRHLLSSATGGSTANINYDVVDHPASSASYPVEFLLEVTPCTNACTGEVASAGVACDAKTMLANLTVRGQTSSIGISIASQTTCTCNGGFSLVGSNCE